MLQSAIDLYMPFYTVVRNGCSRGHAESRRYPHKIKVAVSRKNCLWHFFRREPCNQELRHKYKIAHKHCRKLIRDYEVSKERDVVDAENVGTFYNFVNNKMACKTGIGAFRDASQNLVTDDEQKANLLNDFSRQFVLSMMATLSLWTKKCLTESFWTTLTFP